MAKLYNFFRDFICEEHREFRFRIGKTLASALSGFIAGAIFSLIFLVTAIIILKQSLIVNGLE